jgi:hypothetical protein
MWKSEPKAPQIRAAQTQEQAAGKAGREKKRIAKWQHAALRRSMLTAGRAHTWSEWAGCFVFVITAAFWGVLLFGVAYGHVLFIEWFFAFWHPLVVALSWGTWLCAVAVAGALADSAGADPDGGDDEPARASAVSFLQR